MVSFGFKYGIPVDADFVADMRFLPNPLLGARAARPHRPRRRRRGLRARPARCRASSSTQYVPLLLGRGRGLPARGQAVHAGRHRLHRRQAPQRRDDRGDRAPAARRAASTPAPSTATWGGNDPEQRVSPPTGAGGRRPRRWPRPARVADRAAAARRRPDRRRAHRRRDGRRQRRLVGPAARRVRRAPARRPADGAGRAVRRRRVGRHLGAGAPAPVRRRRRDARPRRRQPADRRRCGSCSATTSTPSTGSGGCSAPRAGCCRWRSPRWTSPPRCAGPADDPDALTTVRGQVEVATTDGVIDRHRPRPARPAGQPGCARRDRRGRLGGARSRLVVLLGDPAPAGARRCARRWSPPRPGVIVVLNLAAQATARRRASGRPTTSRCCSSTRPTSASTPCSPTPATSASDRWRSCDQVVDGRRRRLVARRRGAGRRHARATTRRSWPRRTRGSSSGPARSCRREHARTREGR